MKGIRSRIASAVAVSVALPLMIVIYILSRAATGKITDAWTVGALIVLSAVLLIGGIYLILTMPEGAEE